MHILDPGSQLLDRWITDRSLPRFRTRQIRRWLFDSKAESFREMTDLPSDLREDLARDFQFWTTRVAAHSRAEDGTEKLLLELHDQQRIECVLLREGGRRTICISSQVGCAMGCVFCASGLDGVVRNLTAGEIVEQMLRLARLLPEAERLSHIVVMGMGEPLANLDHLLRALAAAGDVDGLGISPRRVTISTVGLPAAIGLLAAGPVHYNLAVSLHAADDALRNKLVPVNKSSGLQAIIEAADGYFEASGRRLTFEYVLLGGINDSAADAVGLADLLAGRVALLNLIPYNRVEGLPYQTPTREAIDNFCKLLNDRGINVQVRRRKGARIDAACGQLRRMRPGGEPVHPPA